MRTYVLPLLLLSGILTSSAESSLCVDYAQQIHYHGNVPGVTWAWDIVVSDEHAYVATNLGLQIFELSTPWAPTQIGMLDSLGPIEGVDLVGDLAFLAVKDFSVAAVDLSNLALPLVLDQLSLTGIPSRFTVRDGLGAVCIPGKGLRLIDATDLSDLALLSFVHLPNIRDVAISQNLIFVAAGMADFQVIDASNPLAPHQIGLLPFAQYVVDLELHNGVAYLGVHEGGFAIVDVQIPSQPQLISLTPAGRVDRVHVEGDRVYAGGSRGEILVFDISDPTAPFCLGKAGGRGNDMSGIASAGPCLLCCYGTEGLGIIDRTFDTTILPVASAQTVVDSRTIAVSGNLAASSYVYDVQLYDISNVLEPSALGIYHPPYGIPEIDLQGNYLYTMEADADLLAVDVSNPLLPEIVSTTDLGSFFSEGSLYADGSILWVTLPIPMVLRAIDISDPTSPTILGSTSIPFAGVMRRMENIIYIGMKEGGLAAVDVSNVAMPQVLTTFPSIKTNALWIEDDHLYAGYGSDFGIWDLANSLNPIPLGEVAVTGYCSGMVVAHGFAYVQASNVGAQVIDVRNPFQPRLIGAATFLHSAPESGIELHSDYVLIPGGNQIGVFALQCDSSPTHAPESAFLEPLAIAPNPFRSSTTITMSPGRQGVVKLDIYDVCGRRVRTLINGTLAADQHTVSWTGSDDDGVAVAPGVFFVRLQENGASQTRKVVLAR